MNAADIFPAVAATWPPATTKDVGPFLVPHRDPGGNRVSAARLIDPGADCGEPAQIKAVEDAMPQQALFQVLEPQTALKSALSARGYSARDHTDILTIPASDLAAVPPPVTAFDIWPPLAIQRELWHEAGIGPERLAVMDRVTGAKTSLFGRINDTPSAVAFVALHGDLAMLHALEVAPHARRQGLARHMMRAAAHWAVQNGAAHLTLLVTQANTGAQAFYSSLGFSTVGSYHYCDQPAPAGA